MSDLGNKPATEATFFEDLAARLFVASVAQNGRHSIPSHARRAINAAEAFFAELEQHKTGGAA